MAKTNDDLKKPIPLEGGYAMPRREGKPATEFEDLLIDVRKETGRLADQAVAELPIVVSPKMQRRLLDSGLPTLTIGNAILNSIDKVNNGSTEKLEVLICKELGWE